MKLNYLVVRPMKRMFAVSLTLALIAVLSGTAMARGGGGHGGGRSGDDSSGDHGGRHGGDGIERHGGRGGNHHGSILRDLPGGHIEITHKGNRIFFHEGRFFNRHHDGFIIVRAPIGVIVPILPITAITLSIGGVTFFATDDTYYRRIPDGYVVVDSPYR